MTEHFAAGLLLLAVFAVNLRAQTPGSPPPSAQPVPSAFPATPVAPAALPAAPPALPVTPPAQTPGTAPAKTETSPGENNPASTPSAASLPDNAPSPPPLPTDRNALINLLNEAQLERALTGLKTNDLHHSGLNDRELERARLQGLLERLGPGADVRPAAPESAKPSPHRFLAEILDGRLAYVRLGAVDPGELAQFDAVVSGLAAQKIHALILDLRGIGYGADFETAAELARRVSPKGRLLFRLEKPSVKQERIFTSNQEPVFSGTLLVLIDETTSGAAEVLAGVLRRSTGALLLGQTTAGQPVEFLSLPIGGGVELRLAVAEAVVGDGERAFPGGFAPDLPIPQSTETTARIFQHSADQGVSGFVFQEEHPRLNEAALVARTNPEMEPAPPAHQKPLLDQVLQRAVDVATAVEFFQKKSSAP